jgi:ATP-binding cassette subfamily B protein
MLDSATKLMLRCTRAGGRYAVLLTVVSATQAAVTLALPTALGVALDVTLAGGPRTGTVLGLVCLLVLVAAATDLLTELATGVGAARATARLRHALLRRLFALSPATAARYQVGDLVTRLSGQAADAGTAANAVVGGAASIVPPVGSLVALALLDPWLGLAFAIGLVILTILMRRYVHHASASARGYQEVLGAIAGRLTETLDGSRTIAAAGTAEQEIRRVLRPLPALREHGTGTWTTLATAAGRTTLLAPLLQIVVIAAGGLLLSAGRLTPGGLLAAVQYAAIGAGLGAVLGTLNRLVRTKAGARRAVEILDEPPVHYGRSPLPDGPGTLELRDVTVDGILDGVSLTIPGGSTVAVVGRSGSGKSTLAAVAGRLRDPDSGTVLLDGVPIGQLSKEALGRAVGYGFERPVLVGATVGEAIALHRPLVTETASVATIDTYVDRLPRKYDTPLEEAPMSGGESQRLGLARALYGERLLVLDDASSSVDSVTEARIADALTRYTAGRTRLVVTHRAATAARADQVAWIVDGKLRALAPHRTLWTVPEYRASYCASGS